MNSFRRNVFAPRRLVQALAGLGSLAFMSSACGTPPTLAAARLTTPVMVGPVKYLGPTEPVEGELPTGPVKVEVYQSAVTWAMPGGSATRSNSMTVAHAAKASKVDTSIIRATKMDDGYDVHVDRIQVKAKFWMALVVSKIMQGGELEGHTVSIRGRSSAEVEPVVSSSPAGTDETRSEETGSFSDDGDEDAQ